MINYCKNFNFIEIDVFLILLFCTAWLKDPQILSNCYVVSDFYFTLLWCFTQWKNLGKNGISYHLGCLLKSNTLKLY